jgi:hypothetical protein
LNCKISKKLAENYTNRQQPAKNRQNSSFGAHFCIILAKNGNQQLKESTEDIRNVVEIIKSLK